MVKNPPASSRDIRDVGSTSESGRSPGRGHCLSLKRFFMGCAFGLYNVLSSTISRANNSLTSIKSLLKYHLSNDAFKSVVLEKTLDSPLDYREIKPVNPKRNQPWMFIGRTDAKAEAPVLWPPDVMSWLIRRDPDAGKYRGQEEKEVTETEMVGWHHPFNGHEFKPIEWGTGKPGMPWSMGLQRVRHDFEIEQQQHSDLLKSFWGLI